MNIEKERELFEDYFKETQFYQNMVKSLKDHNFNANALDLINGHYRSIYVQLAFDSWIASRNREGYVLVPVEATNKMLNSGYSVKHEKIIDLGNVYKAMIGEVDDV